MIKTHNMEIDVKDGIAYIGIGGRLTETEMSTALDWLGVQTDEHAQFNLCVTMHKLNIPSLGAAKEELSRLDEVFQMLKSVPKAAVISESQFIRAAAAIEGALIPNLKIKAYETKDRAKAINWLKAG